MIFVSFVVQVSRRSSAGASGLYSTPSLREGREARAGRADLRDVSTEFIRDEVSAGASTSRWNHSLALRACIADEV